MKRHIISIATAAAVAAAALTACRTRPEINPADELKDRIRQMADANTAVKRNAQKAWAADSLDLNLMDDSELRTQFIYAWIELYRGSSGGEFPEKITGAAKRLIARAARQAPQTVDPIVRTIAERLVASNRSADTGAAAAIAAYPHGFDISPGTYSEIADRLLGATLLPGRPSPAIEGAAPITSPPPATLLLFYETNCHNCEALIEELIEAYDILQDRGVRVISVSSDTDRHIFESHAAGMPWTDKLCDFKSFAGANFRRWRVASTPTMWLIDDKGVVVGQFRSLGDTGLLD